MIDFFHLCEYLSPAAKAVTPTAKECKTWMDDHKERLKTERAQEVIQALKPYLETPNVPDIDAPVRQCHRYMSNRLHQVDYQHALANDLPIGSGETESAHRYVAQKPLKLPGAWWIAAIAELMLALRLNRPNKRWNQYWVQDVKLAA